jgi:HTH-type transcriptional regulator, competence development regulator
MRRPSKLGQLVRSTRESKGFKLREFAREIGKSPSFVVMLEKEPEPPSVAEETLKTVARVLDLELDQLIALSGRIPEDLQHSSQQEIALFRLVKELTPEQQAKLLKKLEDSK